MCLCYSTFVSCNNSKAKLERLLSCSYENDINARCGDPDDEFKMKHCCDGGGYVSLQAHIRGE